MERYGKVPPLSALFRPPVGGAPFSHWYRAGAPPKGGLLQRTGCDRMRDLAAPITQAFSRVVACTNFGKKIYSRIVGRELVVQFSKKGGWYETWPSTTFATDTAAAGTTVQERQASFPG